MPPAARFWIMRRFLILLIPLLLQGQIVIDTTIPLPCLSAPLLYVPDGNKLYLTNYRDDAFLVLDCETYEIRNVIPIATRGHIYPAWNWRRNKIYCVFHTPDSIAVIDATADTLLKWIPFGGVSHPCYVSTNDQVYAADRTINVIDCETDSIIKVFPPYPYEQQGSVSWDSVGNKVYVGADWNNADLLQAYSCKNDSFLTAIHTHIGGPDVVQFNLHQRKGYFTTGNMPVGPVSVIDCEHDSLIRTYLIYNNNNPPGAWDSLDDKFYVLSSYEEPDTLFVIDCVTDSIIKKVLLPYAALKVCWVPWSNHLYITIWDYPERYITVLDCRNDSIIVPRLEVGSGPTHLAINGTNQRVYVTCYPDSALYVLKDEPQGIPESPSPAENRARLIDQAGGVVLCYQLNSPSRVRIAAYDLTGRLVKSLFTGYQEAGIYRLTWDRTDATGRKLSSGAYFITVDAGEREVLKMIER